MLGYYRLIMTAWIISFLPSAPCFYTFQISTRSGIELGEHTQWEECTSNFSGWSKNMKKAYFTGVFLIVFVIPLVIMVTLYTHILVQLRNKARDNKRASMLEMGEQQQVSKRSIQ